jgi:hypothetical protein
MKKILVAALVILSGCQSYSNGSMPQSTATSVSLQENNYKVVKAGASGQSMGFYLLGILPIVQPNFAEAKSSLYKSIGQTLEGRSVALANQTQDTSSLYLILFSLPKIVVTADVVEFTDDADLQPAKAVAVK